MDDILLLLAGIGALSTLWFALGAAHRRGVLAGRTLPWWIAFSLLSTLPLTLATLVALGALTQDAPALVGAALFAVGWSLLVRRAIHRDPRRVFFTLIDLFVFAAPPVVFFGGLSALVADEFERDLSSSALPTLLPLPLAVFLTVAFGCGIATVWARIAGSRRPNLAS